MRRGDPNARRCFPEFRYGATFPDYATHEHNRAADCHARTDCHANACARHCDAGRRAATHAHGAAAACNRHADSGPSDFGAGAGYAHVHHRLDRATVCRAGMVAVPRGASEGQSTERYLPRARHARLCLHLPRYRML